MTILGKHTIAETQEFYQIIEFQVQAEDKLIAKHSPLPKDPATVAAMAAYTAWKANWRKVSNSVLSDLKVMAVSNPLVPNSSIASEQNWTKLKCAVNKSCDESHTNPGDMREVMNAVDKALGEAADLAKFREEFPEVSRIPDPDLALFKELDAIKKAGEGAVKDVSKAIPWYFYVGGAVVTAAVAAPYVTPFLPKRR